MGDNQPGVHVNNKANIKYTNIDFALAEPCASFGAAFVYTLAEWKLDVVGYTVEMSDLLVQGSAMVQAGTNKMDDKLIQPVTSALENTNSTNDSAQKKYQQKLQALGELVKSEDGKKAIELNSLKEMVLVEEVPTKPGVEALFSMIIVVGARSETLIAGLITYVTYSSTLKVVGLKVDADRGMAACILSLQTAQGSAVDSATLNRVCQGLLNNVVLPTTVEVAMDPSLAHDLQALHSVAAIDRWQNERTAWAHGLLFGTKLALDQFLLKQPRGGKSNGNGHGASPPSASYGGMPNQEDLAALAIAGMSLGEKKSPLGNGSIPGRSPLGGGGVPEVSSKYAMNSREARLSRTRRSSTGKEGVELSNGPVNPNLVNNNELSDKFVQKKRLTPTGDGFGMDARPKGAIGREMSTPVMQHSSSMGASVHGTNLLKQHPTSLSPSRGGFAGAPPPSNGGMPPLHEGMPDLSALAQLGKTTLPKVDEKKPASSGYISKAKKLLGGLAGSKTKMPGKSDGGGINRTLSTPVPNATPSVSQSMHGTPVNGSAVPSKEASSSTVNSQESRPLRHMESFSKRSKHAWHYMPWVMGQPTEFGVGVHRAPGIDEFDVSSFIGEGLTSTVYLARLKRAKELAPGLENKVVLKVMPKDKKLMDGQTVGEVAQREIQILADVQSSPFVIKLFGLFETPQFLFMVTEWAPCDFFQLTTDHFSTYRYWCNVRIYAAQVLLALEHLHGLGYIYCDLKPENLLVCCDGSVKISDMGLAAKMPEDGSKLFRVCGTSEYMSPEMVTRKGYNFMTDIWSYGIFVYELLTCITPFQAMENEPQGSSHVVERIRRHTEIKFPIDVKVEKTAKKLITELLAREVTQRLGAQDTVGNYESIKGASWFADIKWHAMSRGLHTPSIFPRADPNMMKKLDVYPWEPPRNLPT